MTRDEFRHAFDRCFVCGRCGATDIHEISRGSFRAKSLNEIAALLKVCRACHDQELPGMPIARQIAYQAIANPEAYDRVRVNVLRRRAPDAVSEKEVIAEIAAIFHRRMV